MHINKIVFFLILPIFLFAENNFDLTTSVLVAQSDSTVLNIYTTDGKIVPYQPVLEKKQLNINPYFSLKYQNTHIYGYKWENSPVGANIEAGIIINKLFVSGFYGLGAKTLDVGPYGIRGSLSLFGMGASFGSIIKPVDWFQMIYGGSAGYWATYDMRAHPENYTKRDAVYFLNSFISSLFAKTIFGKSKIRFEGDYRILLGIDFAFQVSAGISFFPSKRK